MRAVVESVSRFEALDYPVLLFAALPCPSRFPGLGCPGLGTGTELPARLRLRG